MCRRHSAHYILKLCLACGISLDIVFNHKKCYLLQFELSSEVALPNKSLSNVMLQWVSMLKYLGVWLNADKSLCADYMRVFVLKF